MTTSTPGTLSSTDTRLLGQLRSILHFPEQTHGAYVHSFGCQLNVSDGERVRGTLAQIGYTLVDEPEEADLIVFNTCAVRGSAEDRLYGILGNVKKLKRDNPDLVLALCGCMASEPQTADYVRKHYPYVDILFGTSAIGRLPSLLLEHYQGKKFACDTAEYDDYETLAADRENPFRACVPVSFGCNNFCTYCIVPYVRGRERSRTPEQILSEVRTLAEQGYKEIMLLGQNVNAYGKDLNPPVSFAELLRQVDKIPGDFVIRFLSSHPKDATTELLDTILQGDKIERHLHLPVQSGSDRILAEMHRHYTVEQYLKIVDYVRAQDPGFSLTSDIIVGFPGETEADFQGTLDLVQRVQYDNLYTFIYSPRKGTKAAEMEDPTPASEKSARMERLLTVQRDTSTSFNQRFLGKTLRVLVQEKAKRPGYVLGKDSAAVIVEFPGSEDLIGQFVHVRITKTRNWAVEGEQV